MKNTLLSVIFDSIFTLFTGFIFAFVMLNTFIDLKPAFYLAIILSIIVSAITFLILKTKRKTFKNKKADDKRLNKLKLGLILMNEVQAKSEIKKAYALKKYTADTDFDQIIDNATIYCKFTFDEVTKADIAEVYKNSKGCDNVTLFITDCKDEVINFAESLNIKIVKLTTLYEIFKSVNYYPNITVEINEPKPTLKLALKNAFNYNKGRNFFIAGFMLMFLSFFTPFKIYYLISGSLFLITSVICMFFGKKEVKKA